MPAELNEIRRSQVVTTFGPGAIVDFRAGGHGGAAVSVVVGGLDAWDKYAPPPGMHHPQTTSEPRLQRLLGVEGFRLPPVVLRENGRYESMDRLPGVRFPTWLHCPRCHSLKQARYWSEDPGDPALYCGSCSSKKGSRVHVVPARFIMVCEWGHLEDFPWHWWVQHRDGCNSRNSLYLKSEGAGLAGLFLRCDKCGARRSMDGCFLREAITMRCRGERPWLGDREACDRHPRAVLRGASNVYFPVIVSALDIPPWSDSIQKHLGIYWHRLVQATDDTKRLKIIRALDLAEPLGLAPEQLLEHVKARIRRLERQDDDSLRLDEYGQFVHGSGSAAAPSVEFEARPEPVPAELEPCLSHVVRVTRLREVRALRAFTRLQPPADWRDREGAPFAPLSRRPRAWLPATEVRGEGIFLGVSEPAIRRWEREADVIRGRANQLHEAYVREYRERFGEDAEPPRHITPRLLLVHSFSHALLRQLSLECGYSTASLRERLYVDDREESPMAGVLIYTATSDSDGTLGGLCRACRPAKLVRIVHAAIQAMEWCSGDPLCIEGVQATSDALNRAACHACLLAPETSCEEFNRLLDRAALVGLPADRSQGFFSRMLRGA